MKINERKRRNERLYIPGASELDVFDAISNVPGRNSNGDLATRAFEPTPPGQMDPTGTWDEAPSYEQWLDDMGVDPYYEWGGPGSMEWNLTGNCYAADPNGAVYNVDCCADNCVQGNCGTGCGDEYWEPLYDEWMSDEYGGMDDPGTLVGGQ
jgi:hypothetical protein